MPSRVSVLLLGLALTACSSGGGRVVAAGGYRGYETTGLASWYGDEVAGNRTASGDLFDPAVLTAAHRSLPLGSYAQVIDIDTGRSVVVRINDRGPGRSDRIIDLSLGAAQRLGLAGRSVMRVRVRPYVPTAAETDSLHSFATADPTPTPSPALSLDPTLRYQIQVASFSSRARAEALASRVGARVVAAGSVYRVRIGPIAAGAVQRTRDAVVARGYGDAQILPAD